MKHTSWGLYLFNKGFVWTFFSCTTCTGGFSFFFRAHMPRIFAPSPFFGVKAAGLFWVPVTEAVGLFLEPDSKLARGFVLSIVWKRSAGSFFTMSEAIDSNNSLSFWDSAAADTVFGSALEMDFDSLLTTSFSGTFVSDWVAVTTGLAMYFVGSYRESIGEDARFL